MEMKRLQLFTQLTINQAEFALCYSPMKSVYLGSTVNLPRCALPSCGLYICVFSTFFRSSVFT